MSGDHRRFMSGSMCGGLSRFISGFINSSD